MLKTFPENKCRLCGVLKSKGLNLLSESGKRSGLISKINKRLSREIHIAASDELPKFICSDCESTVNKFSEFCATVQSVQKQLEREKLALISGAGDAGDVSCDQEFAAKQVGSSGVGGYGFEGPGSCGRPTVMVGPDGRVECTLCSSFLDAAEHTTLHMVGHGIGTVICRCRSCGRQGELPHFLRSGEETPGVWCEPCRRPISRRPANSFPCDVCSKSFRSRGHLGRHQVTHSGAKPYLCEVCGCGFSQKSSLKLHVLGHARLNPHKCPRCGQAFRFKVSLNSHVLNVHGGAGTDKLPKHRCDKCSKRFATVYKLRRHYRCHTGDRPYECPRCGKLFSQTGNLNSHRKKHEEEDANSFRQRPPPPAPFDVPLVARADDRFVPAAGDMDAKFLGAVLPQQLDGSGRYEAPHFPPSPDQYLVPTGDADKAKATESELFSHFSHDGLLFIDEDAGPSSETIALPTFSSLQAGALPHH